MNRSDASVVLVTRGDVDLTPILETLIGFDEVVIWDNSRRADLGIFGRYAAIEETRNDVIVTQDDDVLVTRWDDLLAAYEPGVLTVNYPEPWDIPWVARGAVFDARLPSDVFARYHAEFPPDRWFTHHACDGVLGLLADTKVVDLGSEDLPHGFEQGRVSTSDGWWNEHRPAIFSRVERVAACV